MATKKRAAPKAKKRAPWRPKNPVLMLRFVGPEGESYGGFRWPLKVGAVVEAPDWDPRRECANGLHGWLWGEGDLGCRREGTDLDAAQASLLGGRRVG